MEKKDRNFLYKLESYTKDLAVLKLQTGSMDKDAYRREFVEVALKECSLPLRWLLREHLKVVWQIATSQYEVDTAIYGDYSKLKGVKERIRRLEKELVIKDIRESSEEAPESFEEQIDIEVLKKGYEYLKDTLEKQEEWLKRNPNKISFKEKIEETKQRIEDIKIYLRLD